MIYLRARFYEPEMNRFSQKDILWGDITVPNSLNSYAYVQNDPLNLIDPSGESLKSAWNSAKTAVKNAWTATKTAVSNAATSVKNWATNTWNKLTNKSSAPAVAPPAPTQQRNALPSGSQTQQSDSNKNAGKPLYRTAGITQAVAQQYDNTYSRIPNAVANTTRNVDSHVNSSNSCGQSSWQEKYENLKNNLLDKARQAVIKLRDKAEESKSQSNPGTLVIGINASGGCLIGGGINAGIGFDSNGNIGIVSGYSYGVSLPSVSAMGYISVSNADKLERLNGESGVIGASAGEMIVGGGEVVMFKAINDSNEEQYYYGGTAMVGIGAGTPMEIHGELSTSEVLGSFNVYDLIIKACNYILN